MKPSQAWKALERYAAKVLGGKRVGRGADFSQSLPDVQHDYFSIEAKYRTNSFKMLYSYMDQAVSYDPTKVPVVVIRRKGQRALAIIEIEELGKLYEKGK